jgi:hypothetical protein
MSDERKKPVWLWIAALLIGLLALYVGSFGPACWLADKNKLSVQVTAHTYRPLIAAMFFGPHPIRRLLRAYAEWHARPSLPIYSGPLERSGIVARLHMYRWNSHVAASAVPSPFAPCCFTRHTLPVTGREIEMTSRKHPSVGFWITVALVVVLVGYPLSLGPMCWLVKHRVMPSEWLVVTYQPLVLATCRNGAIPKALTQYTALFAPSYGARVRAGGYTEYYVVDRIWTTDK